MTDKSDGPLLEPEIVKLTNWKAITEALADFPPPTLTFDEDGDLSDNAWAFRGVGNAEWHLEPSIERNANGRMLGWPALEVKVSEEFRSRANLYPISPQEGELGWLALMQHNGVPTRLLDFTLSPFIGLYFAAKPYKTLPGEKKPELARLWALDSNAVYEKSVRSVARARTAERERSNRTHGGRASLNPDDSASDRDVMKREAETRRRIAEDVLAPTGTFRSELGKQGCVCVAMPPSSNPRLASQQGLFLLNGAQGLVFQQSLVKMMGSTGHGKWCKAFDIPVGLLPEIETRLFQMNIHEQSLFPDIAGLAGFIKQRIRLHWSEIV